MNSTCLRVLPALLLVFVLAACGDDDTAPGADLGSVDAARLDSGSDAMTPTDASLSDDAATSDDAAVSDDASTFDDASISDDASASDDASTPGDASTDSGTPVDAAAANACVAAGGSCVALVPRACPMGIIGAADTYSCGPGIGVQCCLPMSTPPYCSGIGGRGEGWFSPDGMRICGASCATATISCGFAGTRNEGWYADSVMAGCRGMPIATARVQLANCAP